MPQLRFNQEECRCFTCSLNPLGYDIVHRHTARIHRERDLLQLETFDGNNLIRNNTI